MVGFHVLQGVEEVKPVVAFLGQAILLVSKIVTGEVVAVLELVFGGVIAVVLVAVGYLLRSDTTQAASEESRTESAA